MDTKNIIVPERLRLSSVNPSVSEVVKASNDALREIAVAVKKVTAALDSISSVSKSVSDSVQVSASTVIQSSLTCIKDFTTTVETPAVAAEHTLYSFFLPAGTLAIDGEKLMCRFGGRQGPVANQLYVRLYLDGQTLADSDIFVAPSTWSWNIDVLVTRTSSTEALATSTFTQTFDPTAVPGTWILTGLNFSGPIEVKLTGESFGGSPGVGDVTVQHGVILKINAAT